MKKLKKEAEELTALDGKADVQGCPRVLASCVSAVLVPNLMDADHGSCEVVGARRKQILGPKLQYMAEIMLGAGTNQGRRQVQQINTGDWRKPEVCIKRKEWEVQRGLLLFDAAGFRVDVNFVEVKRVRFGEEARRNSMMEGRADFQ